jgi:hypothetical protein
MFIPVGTATQHIFQVDKDADGNVTKTQIMAVQVNSFFRPSISN